MRLKSPWSARLADSEGNPSHRLLEALSQDILAGHLQGGDRLPPHRELAWTLRLGVGTVTKAYAILERRGLARSIKGKGTFVAELQAEKGPLIDLSVNAIPPMLSDRLLARTLSTVARKIDAQHVHLRPPLAGHNAHRRILGRWLESLGIVAEPNRIVLTGSGQQALWLAFDTLCGGRGLIVTERLSYSGAIALARHRGHPILGVEIGATSGAGSCRDDSVISTLPSVYCLARNMSKLGHLGKCVASVRQFGSPTYQISGFATIRMNLSALPDTALFKLYGDVLIDAVLARLASMPHRTTRRCPVNDISGVRAYVQAQAVKGPRFSRPLSNTASVKV